MAGSTQPIPDFRKKGKGKNGSTAITWQRFYFLFIADGYQEWILNHVILKRASVPWYEESGSDSKKKAYVEWLAKYLGKVGRSK